MAITTTTSRAPQPAPGARGRWPWVAVGAVVLAGLGFGGWYFWVRKPPPKHDPVAAAQANLRGIGLMEQFDYYDAAKAFEEAVKLDPDWLPGQINLGIALLNTAEADNLEKSIQIFRRVLEKDPDSPHAHYCLGIIYLYLNRRVEAAAEFETGARLDPNGADAWLHRGLSHAEKDDAPEAKRYYRKALDLNPYLNAARHALAQHGFEHDDKKSKDLLDEHKALFDAHWESDYQRVYTDMGKYAEVIGRIPAGKPPVGPLPLFERYESFRVTLAADTRWAKEADLGDGVLGNLRRAVRDRFGGALVRLDFNRDGRPDLLLLGAVVRNGKLGDLMLRNDGGGRFS